VLYYITCDEMTARVAMDSTEQIVKDSLKAMERASKKSLASKEKARAFLVRAGILKKRGKGLAKPYA
jgi:hypothetical protein